nr:hypothetical protein [Chlamydiota bacterium]
MSHALSSAAGYLASFWKAEPSKTVHAFSKQGDPCLLTTTQLATRALNQQISDLLPGCSLCKATLRETKQGERSFHAESGETIVFSDEKALDQWLADKSLVDIWQIEDRRAERTGVFYKLQRVDAYGYNTFETRDALFNQLREDYGVFWKLEDHGTNQTSYIHYKPGIFGNRYVDVNHEDVSSVANNLKLENPHLPVSTSHASNQTSWGKSVVAYLLGGLLISSGRSWSQSFNQNSVAVVLGPAAIKTASTFAAIAAVSRQQGGALPGALLAGIMFLPESVRGQAVCPQLVGSYNTPDSARDVVVSGNYAYVADGGQSSGLQIIDVSNITNPTFAGFYDTPGISFHVAFFGNYAYMADWTSGLQIIDVSNVTNPTLTAFYDTPDVARNIVLSGNYAYVADGGSGLLIIDVSNATNPTLAGSYNTPDHAFAVVVSGNYAYMANGLSGLLIIDISNVANPTFAGSYNTPDSARAVVVSGNYAYVADRTSGLQIIDVSNATNPTLLGSYNTPGNAVDIDVSGNYAYIAGYDAGGVQIIDVSNAANPTFAGSYNNMSSRVNGVVVSGNYAYVANFGSGLVILDVSIPCPTTSSSSTGTTSFLASTLQSTTTLFSLSADSTKTTTPVFISTTGISSDTSSFLWIVGLAAGGVLCFGLTGGTALILRRRRGSKAHDSFVMEPVVRRAHKEIGRQYYQLSKISKGEAREVYEQTGHLIVFPEGKKKIKCFLGKGNFGTIKVAQRIEDQEYVASKKVQGEESIRKSEKEADMQKEAAGENVLPIYNTIRLEEALYHFMPLAGFGNGKEIQSHLSALNNPMLTTEILKFVTRDILTGLKTIHDKGIYHLDIKP